MLKTHRRWFSWFCLAALALGFTIGIFIYSSNRGFYFYTTLTIASLGALLVAIIMAAVTLIIHNRQRNNIFFKVGLYTGAAIFSAAGISLVAVGLFSWAFKGGLSQFLFSYGLPCLLFSLLAAFAADFSFRKYSNIHEANAKLVIKAGGQTLQLSLPETCYLTAHRNKTIIYLLENEISIRKPIKELGQLLPENFMRIHKSHILNLDFLERLEYNAGGAYWAYLNTDSDLVLPVGRSYAAALKAKLADKK